MLTKTEIKSLVKREKLQFRKEFGQNFLIDKNLRDKIIRFISLARDDEVLEIGPGFGALTEGLVRSCRYVCAIEKDRKLAALLSEILHDYQNLDIIEKDILEFKISPLTSGKLKVVGALPYYITSPIIQHLLSFRESIDAAYIIIQREVARRIVARAGDDDYSSLSLFVQFYADSEILMDINPDSFFPRPEVHSSLLKLSMLPDGRIRVKDIEMLFRVIRSAFNQRRKTLLASLSHKEALGCSKSDIKAILDALRIDSRIRPEKLPLESFAAIADAVIDFLL